MTVIVNPGAGPATDYGRRSERLAGFNAIAFVVDVGLEDTELVRVPKLDGDGRYGFVLRRGKRALELLMPGVARDAVRYMDEPGQNIWNYPRLYIDGNSYVWLYAISVARDALEEKP